MQQIEILGVRISGNSNITDSLRLVSKTVNTWIQEHPGCDIEKIEKAITGTSSRNHSFFLVTITIYYKLPSSKTNN